MIYILGIVAYLLIGGLLSGVFEDVGVDEFIWYLVWPVLILIWLLLVIEAPFHSLGRYMVTKIRQIRSRRHK